MLLFNTGIHGVCICFTYVFTISKCSPAEISTVGARRGSRKGFFCAQMTWEIYFQLDSCGLLEKVRRLWDQIKPYKTILCIYIYIHQMNFILYIYPGFCQVVYIPGSCQVVQYIHANGSGFYATSPPVNMEFARNPCS